MAHGLCSTDYQKQAVAGLITAGLTDPTPIRDRIAAQLSRGRTLQGLANEAGVDPSGLRRFQSGGRGQQRLNAATTERLMNVPLPPDDYTTERRLLVMNRLGYSRRRFAAESGLGERTLDRGAAVGGRYSAGTKKKIAAGYERLLRVPSPYRRNAGMVAEEFSARSRGRAEGPATGKDPGAIVPAETQQSDQTPEGAGAWGLVTAAQAGDQGAYGELYELHKGHVNSFILARCHDQHLADDLTSKTFLCGFRGIGTIRDQGVEVGAWFTTIARNQMLDHWKSGAHKRSTPVADVPDVAGGRVGPEEEVVAGMESRELEAVLVRGIAGLTTDQRECIELGLYQHMSNAEIAVVTGRNVGMVKALRHRAFESLRRVAA